MKYCIKCKRKLETQASHCPHCGAKLYEISQDTESQDNEYEAAEIISGMQTTGIL